MVHFNIRIFQTSTMFAGLLVGMLMATSAQGDLVLSGSSGALLTPIVTDSGASQTGTGNAPSGTDLSSGGTLELAAQGGYDASVTPGGAGATSGSPDTVMYTSSLQETIQQAGTYNLFVDIDRFYGYYSSSGSTDPNVPTVSGNATLTIFNSSDVQVGTVTTAFGPQGLGAYYFSNPTALDSATSGAYNANVSQSLAQGLSAGTYTLTLSGTTSFYGVDANETILINQQVDDNGGLDPVPEPACLASLSSLAAIGLVTAAWRWRKRAV